MSSHQSWCRKVLFSTKLRVCLFSVWYSICHRSPRRQRSSKRCAWERLSPCACCVYPGIWQVSWIVASLIRPNGTGPSNKSLKFKKLLVTRISPIAEASTAEILSTISKNHAALGQCAELSSRMFNAPSAISPKSISKLCVWTAGHFQQILYNFVRVGCFASSLPARVHFQQP